MPPTRRGLACGSPIPSISTRFITDTDLNRLTGSDPLLSKFLSSAPGLTGGTCQSRKDGRREEHSWAERVLPAPAGRGGEKKKQPQNRTYKTKTNKKSEHWHHSLTYLPLEKIKEQQEGKRGNTKKASGGERQHRCGERGLPTGE